jgi:hypothetical protein
MNYPSLALATVIIGAISFALARRTGRYALSVTAGGGIVFWLHSLRYFGYTSDDSYISYRYARNFADGLGLVWNRGEHVEGYTNFLWVVILAGFDKAGADIVFTGRWLGFALGVAAIGGTYALARALAGKDAGPGAGFAAAFLLAASGPFAMWGTAGLETSLFAVLLIVAVLAHMREQQAGVLPLSGALWAFVLMTHPSGVIAFGVSLVFKAAESATRAGRAGAGRPAPYRTEVRALAIWLASFAVLFVPYFAWRYAAYGWLFPNTYYAKVGSGIDQYARGLLYADRFFEEYAIWMLLAVPVALFSGSLNRMRSGYVLAIVGAMMAYIVYVGGDSLLRYRFFAPMLPLVYAVSVASAAAIARNVRGWDASRPWAATAAACAAAAALTLFTLQASAGDTAVRSERVAVQERVEMGRWMAKNLPASTVVAVVPAGSIPYESRLPSIDMLGLSDEHIAHRQIDLPAIIVGHEKYDSEYVLDRKPEIIILNDHLTRAPWRLPDYDALRGQVITAIPDMLKSPRLVEEYELRSAEIIKGSWLNLFVRRDADAVLSRTLAPPGAP